MPPLTVQAHGYPGGALAGNDRPASVLVSVNDSLGAPVADLEPAQFQSSLLKSAPYGSPVLLSSVTPKGELPGFYDLHFIPVEPSVWAAGEFVVAIAVTRQRDHGIDQGQTIAGIPIP
jgi:hypothetical protein